MLIRVRGDYAAGGRSGKEVPADVACRYGRSYGIHIRNNQPMVKDSFAATGFTPPVEAGDGFQPIPPEELKMTSESQAPGAPAIILFRQVDRDDNGRTSHQFNYRVTPVTRHY